MSVFEAALIQMRSGRSVEDNVRVATEMIRSAKSAGADFVMTPENTTILEFDREKLSAATHVDEGAHPQVLHFQSLADELDICLLIGSMPVQVGPGKWANRSFLFRPGGASPARYDKIHMFDVTVSETEQYRESKNYRPGSRPVAAETPWGKLGMTVCYDLRFPYLYRALAEADATFISVPSAFTKPTGAAHWHVLLRARAIETGCFVFAPAQGGTHENGRETFGHSLIIGPWGEVLAEAGEDPCILMAKIDTGLAVKARARIPSLTHTAPMASVAATI